MRGADLIIIGGGCAGLSLALQLSRSKGHDLRVAVLEPRPAYQHDRTWCFWGDLPPPLRGLVAHEWPRWQFSDGVAGHVHAAPGTPYRYLRSGDFYERAQQILRDDVRIELHQGVRAGAIGKDSGDSLFVVETDGGEWRAAQVVDTRPPGNPGQAILQQVFAGAEIRTETPVFDPECAGLMEDMGRDEKGFYFTYVLPFEKNRGLVEFTRFTPVHLNPDALSADLDRVLEARYGPNAATVLDRESGSIPMGLKPVRPKAAEPGVIRAGTAAGAVRAATGYAFMRIQNWAERAAKDLIRGRAPAPSCPDGRALRHMDRIFLQVLARSPEYGPEVMMTLARVMDGPEFVRFMSGRAGIGEWARIVAALPKATFLANLMRGMDRL